MTEAAAQLSRATWTRVAWHVVAVLLILPSAVLLPGSLIYTIGAAAGLMSAPLTRLPTFLFYLCGSVGLIALWVSTLVSHHWLALHRALLLATLLGLGAGIMVILIWLPSLLSNATQFSFDAKQLPGLSMFLCPLPVALVNLLLLTSRLRRNGSP